MKYILVSLLSLLTTFIVAQSEPTNSENQKTDTEVVPEDFASLLKFDTRSIALGEVKQGEKRDGQFAFTNVSKEDVQIEFISVCECTEVDYPY